jgi:hypothetical protein
MLPPAATLTISASRSAYAQALALMERGIVTGREGDADAAEHNYRAAIDALAEDSDR